MKINFKQFLVENDWHDERDSSDYAFNIPGWKVLSPQEFLEYDRTKYLGHNIGTVTRLNFYQLKEKLGEPCQRLKDKLTKFRVFDKHWSVAWPILFEDGTFCLIRNMIDDRNKDPSKFLANLHDDGDELLNQSNPITRSL